MARKSRGKPASRASCVYAYEQLMKGLKAGRKAVYEEIMYQINSSETSESWRRDVEEHRDEFAAVQLLKHVRGLLSIIDQTGAF